MDENFSAMFEAVILEDAHIQSETFKVTIPYLFSTRKTATEGEETISDSISDNTTLLNGDSSGVSGTVEGTTVLIARNFTDYTFQLKGDIFEMESSEGKTMTDLGDSGGIKIKPIVTSLQPHYHKWKDPHKMMNLIFENLNNIIVKKDTKCYGFFINGANDPDGFVITRIEGVIPLTKAKLPQYEK